MPLRDHFHPPLAKRHSWDELHGGWPMKIVETLQPVLPEKYIAGPQIHLGGAVEIDIGTFQQDEAKGSIGDLGDNTAEPSSALWQSTKPTLCVETELPDVDEYEVRIYDANRGRKLVAAIEIVSPSNKDRPETRSAFVTKCAALLRENVSVAIIDVVTSRDFNLYVELLDFLGQADDTAGSDPSNIYAVACRGRWPRKRWQLEAWNRPLKIGEPLPSLPIWLTETFPVTLDLEASYEATCRVLRMT